MAAGAQPELDIVQSLARFVCEQILWAGYYRLHKGEGLPTVRDFSE